MVTLGLCSEQASKEVWSRWFSFYLPQSMEGPCPATEHWPGSGLQRLGKAAALESYLDGIKILLWPRKKSEAFGRRRQCHQRVRRRLLGSSLGSGDWAPEPGRAGSDRETQNQRKSWTRGKEWLCSVYSVKEGVTGVEPSWTRRRLPWRIFQGGARRRSHSRCWRWLAPSPESHSPRKEARKGCVKPAEKTFWNSPLFLMGVLFRFRGLDLSSQFQEKIVQYFIQIGSSLPSDSGF